MIKKISKIFLLGAMIYFLFLIELSNLYAFPFLLVVCFLINFLEEPTSKTGLYVAFFVGLFWDIYSSNYIGLMALILPIICYLLKIILSKYVRIFSISW
ncbi:MAG: rod shape-determining protein MreD, partial [Candidatus Pacebacteria bacterium]|nr:rod shape-determining protein MreD [Candidatus Paceibacterota bacterium]